MKEPTRKQKPDIPGKRVEIPLNESIGESNLKIYEGDQLIEEVKDHKFVLDSAKSYMESWEEKKWRHLWEGYADFIKADQPNRQAILAESKALIETWFKRGVTYGHDLIGFAAAFGTKVYTNEPDELYDLLEIAHGKIKANILEWKRIPEYLRPQLLMSAPAFRPELCGLEGEQKASFYWRVNGPSYPTVLDTEDKPPAERAELVANNWYDLQSRRLYGRISETYAKGSADFKKMRSRQGVEDYLEIEQRLKSINLSQIDRIAFIARRQGWEFTEVAKMLRALGINRSTEAVKKNDQRHSLRLIKATGNKNIIKNIDSMF